MIATSPSLLAQLHTVATTKLSPSVIQAQRISWCTGQTHVPRGMIETTLNPAPEQS